MLIPLRLLSCALIDQCKALYDGSPLLGARAVLHIGGAARLTPSMRRAADALDALWSQALLSEPEHRRAAALATGLVASAHIGVATDKCLQLSIGTPAAPASLTPATPSRLERLVRSRSRSIKAQLIHACVPLESMNCIYAVCYHSLFGHD